MAAQQDGRIAPDVTWHVAARRSLIQKLPDGAGKAIAQQIERAKARVRARVEHIFHVIKNRFGFKKARWQEGPLAWSGEKRPTDRGKRPNERSN